MGRGEPGEGHCSAHTLTNMCVSILLICECVKPSNRLRTLGLTLRRNAVGGGKAARSAPCFTIM